LTTFIYASGCRCPRAKRRTTPQTVRHSTNPSLPSVLPCCKRSSSAPRGNAHPRTLFLERQNRKNQRKSRQGRLLTPYRAALPAPSDDRYCGSAVLARLGVAVSAFRSFDPVWCRGLRRGIDCRCFLLARCFLVLPVFAPQFKTVPGLSSVQSHADLTLLALCGAALVILLHSIFGSQRVQPCPRTFHRFFPRQLTAFFLFAIVVAASYLYTPAPQYGGEKESVPSFSGGLSLVQYMLNSYSFVTSSSSCYLQ
jgi:hypothetical protein